MSIRPALMTLMLLCALTLVAPTAMARLGETEAQCAQRYGKIGDASRDKISPVLSGALNRNYRFEGWRLRVAFIDNRAVRISYAKDLAAGVSPVIKDDEAAAILKGEAGSGAWKAQSNISINPLKTLSNGLTHPKVWANSNGNMAHLQPGSTALVVESPAADAFTQAQADQKEQKRKASVPNF